VTSKPALFSVMFALAFLLLVVASGKVVQFRNEPCREGRCPVQVDAPSAKFNQGTILSLRIHNINNTDIEGGMFHLSTEGYGCILFFCSWAAGPKDTSPTCETYPGLKCEGDVLIKAGETKDVFIDFNKAITEAGNTAGCCSVDSRCGCMIRGTTRLVDKNGKDTAHMFMSFTCDLKKKNCGN